MKGVIALAFIAGMTRVLAADEVRVVDRVPAGDSNLYVFNRAPLQPAPMVKLPVGAISPKGWLRRQLELDAQGMAGNLPQISPFLKAGGSWASPTGEGNNGWEEPVYWLRGHAELAYVLNDPALLATTKKWVEAMIASRRPDGYFGPRSLLTRENGMPDLWPHTLALNILQSYYEFTGDARALETIQGYCGWLAQQPEDAFRKNGLVRMRGIEYIATLQWLYNRTGDAKWIELSKRIQSMIADWTRDRVRPARHNVDFSQCFRGPAQHWVQTGDAKHLAAARARYDEMMGEFGQFPGGGFAGDENIRDGFIDPRQGFETCGFVEFMHSFAILTRIEGDPIWADRAEEIAFNSYPAALMADHKGLHYVTCANMVRQDFRTRRVTFADGWVKTGYSPTTDYRCCQHNHTIGWPMYAQELWLATADRGLCASLYAASSVKANVGEGTAIAIETQTDYPFNDAITMTVSVPKKVAFPLYLRVPAWCAAPVVKINGRVVKAEARPLSYIVLNRTWANGDRVELTLPMRVWTKTWKKNHDSVSVAYGPLWFSLKIGEEWKRVERDGRLRDWPGWEVYPTTPWNYGLVLDAAAPEKSFNVTRRPGPVSAEPFTPESTPFTMVAQARRIPEWGLAIEDWIAPLQPSPAFTQAPVETVTLIPLGAARLRISSFPTVSDAPAAHRWTARKMPFAGAFKVSASHAPNDVMEAVNDGVAPERSGDGDIPRMTWWDHKGTAEWVQYDFDQPRAVSSVAVYWFDDGPNGGCRIPASWRVLYREGGAWKPVTLAAGAWQALEGREEYAARKDEFNTVRFNEVTTDALRIEVKLQDKMSGGVLEWRVNE